MKKIEHTTEKSTTESKRNDDNQTIADSSKTPSVNQVSQCMPKQIIHPLPLPEGVHEIKQRLAMFHSAKQLPKQSLTGDCVDAVDESFQVALALCLVDVEVSTCSRHVVAPVRKFPLGRVLFQRGGARRAALARTERQTQQF